MTEVASHTAASHTAEAGHAAENRSAIDAAVRPVVVSLFISAVGWLLLSSLLSAIAAVKLQWPGFLNYSFLTYGRVVPAADGAFTFGWCSTACLGVAIWVVSRLSGRAASGVKIASFGAFLWNGGVLLGVVSVLLGRLRPLNGIEFPFGAFLIMFLGLCAIVMWLAITFRSEEQMSLSMMFVVGGVAWLGWSLFTGNLLIELNAVRGIVQQVVAAWTASGVLWLWIVPVALGTAYFLVPKVTGSPLFSGPIGRAFFWLYFITAGLVSFSRLSGGPVPLWMVSVSAACGILLLVPVLGTAYNLLATARGSSVLGVSPSMRFVFFGVGILSVGTLLFAASGLRSFGYALHFTMFDFGVRALLLQGGATMVLFGAIYYIMPRLSGCEWLSSSLVSFHFLGSAYGSSLGSATLIVSGLAAGSALGDPESSFSQVLELASSYYWGRTLSYVLLFAGYLAFALHFLLMAVRIGQPAGEATLLRAQNDH